MKYLTPVALSILTFSLGACGQAPQRDSPENQAATTNTVASAKSGPSERLLAAAEPFEKLTEIAFTAPLPEIDKTIADASPARAKLIISSTELAGSIGIAVAPVFKMPK